MYYQNIKKIKIFTKKEIKKFQMWCIYIQQNYKTFGDSVESILGLWERDYYYVENSTQDCVKIPEEKFILTYVSSQ